MKELHTRQVATDLYGDIKPAKYSGYEIPKQFIATFYIIDNDNVKVTNANFKKFNTWKVKLFVRITEKETVEVVKTEIYGANVYKGHTVFTTKEDNPFTYGTVQARHYTALRDNRPRLVSVAVQVALQSHKFTKKADGTYQVTVGDNVSIDGKELERINRAVTENSYDKLDDAHYRRVAEIYKQAVLNGDRPNNVLMLELNKERKTVQGYTKVCRDRGYLLPAKEKGKASPVKKPKTTTKGKTKK